MFNLIYRLTAPGVFGEFQEEMELSGTKVLVCPTHLSICHADQRYYQGSRPAKVLKEKLPLALIHEAAGTVLYDPAGIFIPGQRVVMVPNQPAEKEKELERGAIEENYKITSRFCGSSTDGFLQEMLALPADRVLLLPKKVPMEIGAFTEMVSVAFHAIRRIGMEDGWEAAVWGDGNLGYLTGLLIKILYPKTNLHIFGVNKEKLEYFTFADQLHFTDRETQKEYEGGSGQDCFRYAFECVGGEQSGMVIGEMIKRMQPEGRIGLLGVAEFPISIPTRNVLEKGLTVVGNSRSSRKDFEQVLKLYRERSEMIEALHPLVGEELPVRNLKELSEAFEKDSRRRWGKTILTRSSDYAFQAHNNS